MKLGLSSASFYGRLETEDAAQHLADFDLDTCEVFLETFSEYSSDFGRTVRSRLGGLPCGSVHPKGTQFESDLFGRSARQRADALRIFTGVCEAGQAIGAKYYVMHGPGMINSRVVPERIHLLTVIVPQLQSIAHARGMEVLWENVSWCAVSTPENVRQLLDCLPEMNFVLDTKQAFRAGQDPLEILSAMGRHIRHVHALDWDADGKLALPGQGIMDWPRLMHQLRDLGFDGNVILEPYAWMAEDEDQLRRSLDFLRKQL